MIATVYVNIIYYIEIAGPALFMTASLQLIHSYEWEIYPSKGNYTANKLFQTKANKVG